MVFDHNVLLSVAPFALEENTEIFQLITVAVHHLLEPLGTDIFAEITREFSVSSDEFVSPCHEIIERNQFVGERGFGHRESVRNSIPDAGVFIKFQLYLSVTDVTPRGVERGESVYPLVLVQDEYSIHCTRDTGAARELIDGIPVIHLPQMVNEQKTDTELVRQLFKDSKLGVVTAVGNVGCGRANELEGVDGYEGHLRVLTLEITEPIADSAFDGSASGSEIHSVGNVVRDGVQALLDPPLAVFQAEVEHISSRHVKPPQGRSLGDVDA